MKATKKVLLTVLALALVVSAVLGLVACNNNPTPRTPAVAKEFQLSSVSSVSNIIVISLDSTIMSDITGKHLIDYLNALVAKGYFDYTMEGGMVTTVNKITVDSTKNQFWAIYTDDEVNSSDLWAAPIVIDGKTYNSASYGITDLPLTEGKSYIFKVSTW